MANVIIDDTNLTNIAAAIREKNNTETTYKPSEMAAAISEIESGSDIPEEAFVISGDCESRFTHWEWFLEKYGDKITTENITDMTEAFYKCNKITSIPFTINTDSSKTYIDWYRAFYGCSKLTYITPIPSMKLHDLNLIFCGCESLRNLPEIKDLDLTPYQNYIYPLSNHQLFAACHSLRSIPENWLKGLCNKVKLYSTSFSTGSYTYTMCQSDYSLDELKNLIPPAVNMEGLEQTEQTSNMFSQTFDDCYRLKDFTFALQEDGTPYVAKWKKQTINLKTVGYDYNCDGNNNISPKVPQYNNGITEETRITDAETYEQFKNHPDSWTTKKGYSRYNHDSAVNTINSLPDTSAYLETTDGTNTIIFTAEAGSLTDGGAINTLTEEEIAVATAKGWTITYQ